MSSVLGKREALEGRLAELGRVVVAYSGGVDSAFLAAVGHEVLGPHSLAATAKSPAVAHSELAAATALACSRGWNHLVVETAELERDGYVRNAPDRCYWCKTELFSVLQPIAAERGGQIVTGTNADDLHDFRPGLTAAARSSIRAPLAEVGLTKREIRALSADIGLPTADKPASPCLASRVAYGVRVTAEALDRIDRAEEFLRSLGFKELRVRDHGDLARIEVPAAEIESAAAQREIIDAQLRALGFRYVALDLRGFRSGSLNEVLPVAIRRPD